MTICVVVEVVTVTSKADLEGPDSSDWCSSVSTAEGPEGGLAGAELSVVVSLEECGITEDAAEFHST